MVRTLTLGKGLIILIGLGLLFLVAVACGTEASPPPTAAPAPATGQAGQQINTAGLPAFSPGSEGGALAPSSYSYPASIPFPNGMNSGIWVTGRGEITAMPDLAVLEVGVQALRDTVAAARRDAGAAMEQVVAALKAHGVADRDIHTRFFNIYPQYTSREVYRCPDRTEPLPAPPTGGLKPPVSGDECFRHYEQVIQGYQVNNQVTVNVRDLDAVGPIIDEVTQAGGDLTRFQSINFTIEDAKPLQTQARVAAVADLMAKADQFAALTGSRLGKLVYITETGGDFVGKIEPFARAAMDAGAVAAATPIMPGELEVVVTVQAVFAID
jgi:uncharacterized protein YggE